MESERDFATDGDAGALDAQLCALEAGVYRSLVGVSEACCDIAQRAEARGLTPQAIRARLLASDVASRLGDAAAARAVQLELHQAATPWPALARRAAMYLTSSCDRIGLRVEAMRWAQAAVSTDDGVNEPPAWRAEALMVAALFTVSRTGADYTLVEQAMSAVRAACDPILVAATAANFGEVAAECGEQAYA